jgi:phosphatidylglycerol lysyltransferase
MYAHLTVEQSRASQIVEAYGCSSIAFQALLGDKDFYFSQGGSLIAYTVYGKVAVALGDPVGPPEDTDQAITGFRSFCTQHGWIATFCLVGPNFLENYKQAGLKYILVGNNAVVNLHDFNLQGKARSGYRKRYNRLRKQGYQFVVHRAPLSEALLDKLHQISDRWLKNISGSEKRFFNGWFDPEYIRSSHVATVGTPQGETIAFANLAPVSRLNEIGVDLVRYTQACPSGMIDFLFVSLFFWAKEQGYDFFNLGGCELARVSRDPSDPVLQRIVCFSINQLAGFYGYKGLYDFKRKFQPTWQGLYLVYPGIVHLPAISYAIARIDAGCGSGTIQVKKQPGRWRSWKTRFSNHRPG